MLSTYKVYYLVCIDPKLTDSETVDREWSHQSFHNMYQFMCTKYVREWHKDERPLELAPNLIFEEGIICDPSTLDASFEAFKETLPLHAQEILSEGLKIAALKGLPQPSQFAVIGTTTSAPKITEEMSGKLGDMLMYLRDHRTDWQVSP